MGRRRRIGDRRPRGESGTPAVGRRPPGRRTARFTVSLKADAVQAGSDDGQGNDAGRGIDLRHSTAAARDGGYPRHRDRDDAAVVRTAPPRPPRSGARRAGTAPPPGCAARWFQDRAAVAPAWTGLVVMSRKLARSTGAPPLLLQPISATRPRDGRAGYGLRRLRRSQKPKPLLIGGIDPVQRVGRHRRPGQSKLDIRERGPARLSRGVSRSLKGSR